MLAVSVFSTGCATKKYVRQQVAAVDNRVSQLASTVQENSERLDATDTRARQGISDAASARAAANAAQAAANQANQAAQASQSAASAAQSSADTANQSAQSANARIATLDSQFTAFQGNNDRYVAGPVTTVMFKVGRAELTKDAMKTLDDVVGPISGLEQGYLVEVQGYTSSEGAETMNVRLSQERSESVQRYLVSKGAPITRIAIVGLGAANPIADNKTRSGREQNRRAEIRVLTAAK
jgi:outer membrane protein OmpA-like peptidoglycan-associated protein